MDLSPLQRAARRRAGDDEVAQPLVATVTRVGSGGSWVTPLDEPTDAPIGPCRGDEVEAGDVVLLVFTQERPWVIAPRPAP